MAANYEGNPASYPTDVTTMEDADPFNAESAAAPLRQLADRTAHLRSRIIAAESDITSIKALNATQSTSIGTLGTTLTGHAAYLSSLNGRLNTAEGDITTLNSHVAGLVPVVSEFTSSGTWTKPAGAVLVQVTCIGGGGAGQASDFSENGGAGGGAGEEVTRTFTEAQLAPSIDVTVGAAGVASGSIATPDGTAGGDTTFGYYALARGGKSAATVGNVAVDGGNAIAFKGGRNATSSGATAASGEGPLVARGTGGNRGAGVYATSGIGYGAGGAGGQATGAGSGGGGGAAGYGLAGSRLTATTLGTNGLKGYCIVTTWVDPTA